MPQPLQIGVLLVPFQTTDVAGPLDILAGIAPKLANDLLVMNDPNINPSLITKCVDVEVHHIGETLTPVTLTSGFRVLPSCTVDDCPPLDYLLVGGPDPNSFTLGEGFSGFVKKFCGELEGEGGRAKGLWTTCTGALAIAGTGVLDGKRATTNQLILGMVRKLYPKVLWEDKPWVVDGEGKFWTAGGACAGMDMLAHWVVENLGFEVAKLGCYMLDFEPRDGKGGLLFGKQPVWVKPS